MKCPSKKWSNIIVNEKNIASLFRFKHDQIENKVTSRCQALKLSYLSKAAYCSNANLEFKKPRSYCTPLTSTLSTEIPEIGPFMFLIKGQKRDPALCQFQRRNFNTLFFYSIDIERWKG